MTNEKWNEMLARIEARAPELTALARTFLGPAEATLAFLVAAHGCAEFLSGFDIVEAMRRIDKELRARHGN